MQTLQHARAIEGGTSDCERPDLLRFSALLLQLIGVAWVVHRFQLESKAFVQLMVLTVVGFAVHYFLPLRYRLPFFLVLSLGGITMVLGGVQAAWLIAVGLGLIGIAHLPIRISARIALLLLASATLLLARAGQFDVPWSAAVWPILASMFMFRMVVYMYDLATGLGEASLSHRLSYFFLLPNVCFPLFPVVDFRTFVRNYYNAPRHQIHQVGLEWMVRGIVQLLLYRLVQLWVISPYDVGDVFSLAHYFVWLYLLYLIISGQFHLIAGMLHLFGFNLPETHRRYYLASSFTDFWRRINIYWKDFMMKVFYYPIYFRLRRFGPTRALVLSIACVFVVTWALHAYQGFWIRGFFHFSWNDTLFWTVLGVLVIANSLYDARHGRRRTLAAHTRDVRSDAALAAKTAATFVAMCVLWSFWSSESVSSWLSLWPAAIEPPAPPDVGILLVGFAAAGALAVALWLRPRWWMERWPPSGLSGRSAVAAGWLLLLAALSMPAVDRTLGSAGSMMASIRVPRLNAFQLEELERGYYEDLLTVDRFNRELGALYAKRPPEWEKTLRDLGAAREGAAPGDNLVPSVQVAFKGTVFRTNRWGMHDQEYGLEAPPRTFRVALLGASHVMGWGVPRNATFEAVLEDRLNAELRDDRFARYEILNFAFNYLTAFEQLHILERKVTRFKPDAVWYVGHPYELKRVVRKIRTSLQSDDPADRQAYPWFADLARRAGVDEHTSAYLAERRLARFGDEIFLKLFGAVVDLCRRHHVRAVYVHMPLTPESRNEVDSTPYVELARRAGFVTLDLTGAYDGFARDAIWIAEWDAHPNPLGHRLVAHRLWDRIQQNKAAIFGADLSSPGPGPARRADVNAAPETQSPF